jgi:hypothetical protein
LLSVRRQRHCSWPCSQGWRGRRYMRAPRHCLYRWTQWTGGRGQLRAAPPTAAPSDLRTLPAACHFHSSSPQSGAPVATSNSFPSPLQGRWQTGPPGRVWSKRMQPLVQIVQPMTQAVDRNITTAAAATVHCSLPAAHLKLSAVTAARCPAAHWWLAARPPAAPPPPPPPARAYRCLVAVSAAPPGGECCRSRGSDFRSFLEFTP